MVHLSYLYFTKLLLALFNVLTPVPLYSSNINETRNVWFNNGSVTYGDTYHMKL